MTTQYDNFFSHPVLYAWTNITSKKTEDIFRKCPLVDHVHVDLDLNQAPRKIQRTIPIGHSPNTTDQEVLRATLVLSTSSKTRPWRVSFSLRDEPQDIDIFPDTWDVPYSGGPEFADLLLSLLTKASIQARDQQHALEAFLSPLRGIALDLNLGHQAA